MDKFWKWLTFIVFGFIAIGVLLHARQAATVMGSFYTGLSNVGRTLEGR